MPIDPATVLLLSALAMAPLNKEVPATYVRNYDGDTVTLTARLLPNRVFEEVDYRIRNIDTAEINGQCDYEKNLAIAARRATSDMLKRPNADIRLFLFGEVDKYGRPLAQITVNGEDLGEKLIEMQLARRWDGARRPWCAIPTSPTKPGNVP